MTTATVSLWFDTEAEEAARHYVEVFGGEVTRVDRQGEAAFAVAFTVHGMSLLALNGGPAHAGIFNEGTSIQVHTDSQEEADRYWDALTVDGRESRCGWLFDRYGFSWQIIPAGFDALFSDPDPLRAQAAVAAMMTMSRLDVAAMKAAADAADTAF